jgi:hypothetical protein
VIDDDNDSINNNNNNKIVPGHLLHYRSSGSNGRGAILPVGQDQILPNFSNSAFNYKFNTKQNRKMILLRNSKKKITCI